MATRDHRADYDTSLSSHPSCSPMLEQLEPRLLLSTVEWLPGLVGPKDFLDDTAGQVIYLDFDGAEDVTYDGPVTVEGIDIPAFSTEGIGLVGQDTDLIEAITAKTSALLSPFGVTVTASLPSISEYSTIYIGGTDDAFSAYGYFNGLAEAVDIGNTTKTDDALVFAENILQGTQNSDIAIYAISGTVVHEAGHLLGLSHRSADSDGGKLDHVASLSVATLAVVGGVGAVAGAAGYTASWIMDSDAEWDWGDFAKAAVYGAAGTIVGGLSNVVSNRVLASALGAASPVFGDLVEALAPKISDVIESAISGIDSMWDALWGGVKSAIDASNTQLTAVLQSVWNDVVAEQGYEPTISDFQPVWADFSGASVVTDGMSINTMGMEYNNNASWRMRYPGTSGLTASFTLDSVPDRPILSLIHLTSLGSMPSGGYSPVDIYVNGHLIANNFDVADHHNNSHGFQTDGFPLQGYLTTGSNSIVIAFEDNPWADTHYWIQNLLVTSGPIPPRVDTFFHTGNPNPIIHGGQLLLSASASDPDGSVDRVEFYRDADGNGVLETGVDEYVGSDSSPQGGEWTWFGEARWSQGTHRFFARAGDNEGLWSSPSSIFVSIGSSPAQPGMALSLLTRTWNDLAPDGDSDSLPEPGETVELEVKLRNSSGQDVEDAEATLTCNLANIQITDATDNYGAILAGEDEWGHNDYHMFLDIPDPVGVTFTLHVTYTQGGTQYFQDITFNEGFPRWDNTVVPHQVVVYDAAPNGDGDGIPESGEYPRFDLYLRNSSPNGSSSAMNVRARIVNTNVGQVRDAWEYYPDLYGGGGSPQKQYGMFIFSGSPIPWSYAGPVTADIEIIYDGLSESILLYDYLLFDAQPDAWFRLEPGEIDFGITGTDQDVTRTVTIRNFGSESLQVSNIVTSDPDTTIQELAGDPLPWTIPAGGTKDITVEIETSTLEGQIQRTVTFSTDARVGAPSDLEASIVGIVSDRPLTYEVSGAAPFYDQIDISDHIIVWGAGGTIDRDVFAYDLASQQTFRVTDQPGDQGFPKIGGTLVAWTTGGDIYAKDLATSTQYTVSEHPSSEDVIGVDGGHVAFLRDDMLYVWSAATGSSQLIGSATDAYDRNCDFADGVLTWTDGSWIMKGDILGNTQQLKEAEPSNTGPVTNDGLVVWTEQDADRKVQIWLWDGALPRQVTTGRVNHGRSSLAVGDGVVLFDKEFDDGVFGVYLATGTEFCLSEQDVGGISLHMDDGIATWSKSGKLYYAIVNRGDISISTAGIAFSNNTPTAGDSIDVTVTVNNIAPWDAQGDIIVRLYGGNPGSGGTQWGPDKVISGGMAAKGSRSVTFNGLVVPIAWEGEREVFAQVRPADEDIPSNNTAHKILDIYDSDTDGPVISSVVVAEHNGDGDGIIGADEQIQISWELTDPSGIGSVELLVNGNPVALDGNYYAVLGPLDADGFNVLEHDFIINATDGDNSPASSQYSDYFDVVPAEEITILYGGDSLVDGEATPIDFDHVDAGATAVSKLFVVRNDGQQSLSLDTINIPEGFRVAGPESSLIAPGDTTYFTVTLDTDTAGAFSGDIVLANSDGPRSPDGLDENSFAFAIIGEVSGPEIIVSGNGQNIQDGDTTPDVSDRTDFGAVLQGQAGIQHEFTVTNNGTAILTLGSVNPPTGFSLVDGLPDSLGPGESDTFTIQLDSAELGVKTGQITFSNNDYNEAPFDFHIRGEVIPVPVLDVQITPDIFSEGVGAGAAIGTVTRTGPTDYAVTVGLSSSDASAATVPETVSIDVGQSSATFLVDAENDPDVDGMQMATITASATGHTSGGHMVEVLDDDAVAGQLPGDADMNGIVDDGDYGILVRQFGLSGNNLLADFNSDGRSDLADFVVLRANFGNILEVPFDLVVSDTTLTVPEGGTAQFDVSLSAQPRGMVTVTTSRTSGDENLSVASGGTLTFDSTDWNIPQTVSIAAGEDADTADGTAEFTITAAGAMNTPVVTATEQDNDGGGLPVDIETVPVGNVWNAADSTGYGAVDYAYNIGKYEVTAGQYTEFLNAVAATDTYGLYSTSMWLGDYACKIERTGSPGGYSYSVAGDWANRPVNYVNWGDAARFANWLHNGQPTGVQNLTTTEDGTYFLNGAMSNEDLLAVARNAGARWAITSEDEWYKAAYYNPTTSSYYDYPTSSNTAPTAEAPAGGLNSANYTWIVGTQTDVGAYTSCDSPYGTFDQGGNVWEWNESTTGSYRGWRGGSFGNNENWLHVSSRQGDFSTFENPSVGFRVAEVSLSIFTSVDALPVGDRPTDIVSGDFNRDGRADLAVANHADDTVSVLYGQAGGGFGDRQDVVVGDGPNGIATGDFNGDGRPDLAITNEWSDDVTILYGQAGGGFGGRQDVRVGKGPLGIISGDFNGDGRPDLAVVNRHDRNVSVLYGQAGGGFGGRQDVVAGSYPVLIVSGDFNGDGRADLAVTNWSGNDVSVLYGLVAGGFGSRKNVAVGNGPRGIVSADFNGDGLADLAVTNTGDDDVSVLYGQADGGFGDRQDVAVGDYPYGIASGDFNGDSRADLAVTNNQDDDVSVLYGFAAGGFGGRQDMVVGDNPYDIISADFNGDGCADLAVTNYYDGDVSVLYGLVASASPALLSEDFKVVTIPAAAPDAPAAPAAALQATVEPIAAASAPVVPIVSQSLDDSDANDDSIVTATFAPAVDLLMPSPSLASQIPESHPIPVGSPATTLYRAATAEYDLRPLSDDLPVGEANDLLADILAESRLVVPL